ncbi:MAG: hypothetical protein JEZ10_05165 [Verrucomicrobia bacterium]|nr:hypothetical protein [Verrucomicrobiota bacterium]
MDCTPFIRTKKLLAAWLVLPPLLITLIALGTREYCNQQRIACEQRETVSRMIPRLRDEAAYARRFLESYSLGRKGSVEDAYIALFNTTADKSGLRVRSINLKQEPIDAALKTARIAVNLEADGTCRQIADFLQKLKSSDPLIYESQFLITPAGAKADTLQINADFIRIYAE